MHCWIFELRDKPLAIDERAEPEDLPKGFVGWIADYVQECGVVDREEEIKNFCEMFDGVCTRNGDEIIFAPEAKRHWFGDRHGRFSDAAIMAAATSYEDFLTYNIAYTALCEMKRAFSDETGFYTLDDYGDFEPFDDFMRGMEPNRPYYFGAVFDYRF